MRFADALVRGLSSVFSVAALGIGCLWMLQDPEKQMWHDKIAGTLVVKVPRHLVLP
ncbi:MAG: RDD family protein [Acidobacteria bacterium]|nr:RDD family protein [Acidobacteriota bacterium]